eukprot:CAMPEP_0204150994 /NCGR_PEP_ID=MMETSP0361-20130328/25782_1 /ASSEMBLY_ACC=CAM_ASM_000343 /TAXON_ID=268821 /ORGANISM="Scrippsiella Hangoei, Strain SHTV-5" /LENGTH=160 /DNA_ID=CAMNT_0051105751 /DNA_START=267 /DNA_END=745 /DNA_ORIENTATION=+
MPDLQSLCRGSRARLPATANASASAYLTKRGGAVARPPDKTTSSHTQRSWDRCALDLQRFAFELPRQELRDERPQRRRGLRPEGAERLHRRRHRRLGLRRAPSGVALVAVLGGLARPRGAALEALPDAGVAAGAGGAVAAAGLPSHVAARCPAAPRVALR